VGTPALSAVVVSIEYSEEDTPGADDWAPLYREEFATSGSGVATLSLYQPTLDSPAVPGAKGFPARADKGLWYRCKVWSSLAATDVEIYVNAFVS